MHQFPTGRCAILIIILCGAVALQGCQWRAYVPPGVSLHSIVGTQHMQVYGTWGPDLRASGLQVPGADGRPNLREASIDIGEHRVVVTAKAYKGYWDLVVLKDSARTEHFAQMTQAGTAAIHGDTLTLTFDGPFQYSGREQRGFELIDLVPLGNDYVSFYLQPGTVGYVGGIRFFKRSNGRGELDLAFQSEMPSQLRTPTPVPHAAAPPSAGVP